MVSKNGRLYLCWQANSSLYYFFCWHGTLVFYTDDKSRQRPVLTLNSVWLNFGFFRFFSVPPCIALAVLEFFFENSTEKEKKIFQTSLNLILYFPFSEWNPFLTLLVFFLFALMYVCFLHVNKMEAVHIATLWCGRLLLARASVSANIYFTLTPRHFTFSFLLYHVSFSGVFFLLTFT